MSLRFDLTNMDTCYQMFRREVLDALTVEENRFGFEPRDHGKGRRARLPGLRSRCEPA